MQTPVFESSLPHFRQLALEKAIMFVNDILVYELLESMLTGI
jgi:hypothetical protein